MISVRHSKFVSNYIFLHRFDIIFINKLYYDLQIYNHLRYNRIILYHGNARGVSYDLNLITWLVNDDQERLTDELI